MVIWEASDDREAHAVCNLLLQHALYQIRSVAYLERHVGSSVGEVKITEEIRRLADLCDGLAGPEAGASDRLHYRLSALSADQASWVGETLNANGYTYRPT